MDTTEIFLSIDEETFCVIYENDNGWYSGKVYDIQEWTDTKGNTGWSYRSKTSSEKMHNEINDDCRILLSFSFVWRGVWDGRLYFNDIEYFSEELKVISELWGKIESMLKAKIEQQ